MMKNVFYLIWKALFILKLFKFLYWLLGTVKKNGLIRKIRLTSKFMTSQHGYQAITRNMLPNISRNKGNQTMKFGQLIEYNKKNFFLKLSHRKCGRETSSRPPFSFQKSFLWTKTKWSPAEKRDLSIYFDSPQLAYNKKKL